MAEFLGIKDCSVIEEAMSTVDIPSTPASLSRSYSFYMNNSPVIFPHDGDVDSETKSSPPPPPSPYLSRKGGCHKDVRACSYSVHREDNSTTTPTSSTGRGRYDRTSSKKRMSNTQIRAIAVDPNKVADFLREPCEPITGYVYMRLYVS